MKRIAAVLCVVMLIFTLVVCGDQTSNVKNEQKETTKTETTSTPPKESAKTDQQPVKLAENVKIDESKEEVLIDLLTIRNLCNAFDRLNEIKNGTWDFEIDSGVPDYINQSKNLNKELKNKLLSSLHDGWGGSKFRAILDVEIEKHKLP